MRKSSRARLALVGAAVLAALAVASPAATAEPALDESVALNSDAAHSGSVEGTTQAPPLNERWRRDLGDVVSYPLVVGGRVFVVVRGIGGGYGSTLHALDAETGEDLWGPADLSGTYFWSGIAAGDGRIYALSGDGFLTAFDQATGEIDWIEDLPGQYSFSSEPTYHEGIVYAGGSGIGGTLYAVGASEGDLLWSTSIMNSDHSSPAVAGDAVFVNSTCDAVRAFHRVTGASLWSYPPSCSGGGGRTAAVADGKVWARQPSGADLILDAVTGDLEGTFASDPLPAFHDGRVFLRNGTTLTARSTSTLAKLWDFTAPQLSSAPLVVNGYVYVGSMAGHLYVLDEVTGELVWTADTPPIRYPDEHNVSEPVTGLGAGDGLIVVPADDELIAFEHLQTRLEPLTPARLLDTRPGGGQIGYSGSKPAAGATVTLPVLGRGGVPASNVEAVVLTVTATEPAAAGWVTAWPSGATMPSTSNLNIERAGQNIANQVIVPVGADGAVALRGSGSTHLVADVTGYFTQAVDASAGRYTPVAPGRLVDTRSSGPGGTSQVREAASTLTLDVLGEAGIPASGVSAVAVNITAVRPTGGGYITAWPSGLSRPLASTVNFAKSDVIAAAAILPVGTDGAIQLYTSARTHLIVDAVGWFTDDSAPVGTTGLYVPIPGTRVLDTRPGTKPVGGSVLDADPGVLSLVPPGSPGIAANLTATAAEGFGYLTGHASGTPMPPTSNVNHTRTGQTIANLALLGLSEDGAVSVYTYAPSDVVLDVAGYFVP